MSTRFGFMIKGSAIGSEEYVFPLFKEMADDLFTGGFGYKSRARASADAKNALDRERSTGNGTVYAYVFEAPADYSDEGKSAERIASEAISIEVVAIRKTTRYRPESDDAQRLEMQREAALHFGIRGHNDWS